MSGVEFRLTVNLLLSGSAGSSPAAPIFIEKIHIALVKMSRAIFLQLRFTASVITKSSLSYFVTGLPTEYKSSLDEIEDLAEPWKSILEF